MIALDMDVASPGWKRLSDPRQTARRAVEAALAVAEIAEEEIAVSLLLGDDRAIAELNRTWRGKDKPTNVLSFPAAPPGDLRGPPPGPRHIGDIALAYETIAEEAREEAKSLEAHVSHLIIHGVLHCLGYDHDTDERAEDMERREIAALARLGFSNPYDEGMPGPAD